MWYQLRLPVIPLVGDLGIRYPDMHMGRKQSFCGHHLLMPHQSSFYLFLHVG